MITRSHLEKASQHLLGKPYNSAGCDERRLEIAKVVLTQEVAENLSLIHDELVKLNRGRD